MYETAYELGVMPPAHFWITLAFALAGVAAVVIWVRWQRQSPSGRSPKAWVLLAWGIVAGLLGTLGACAVMYRHTEARRALESGNVQVVERSVEVLRQQPGGGHAPGDLIRIGDREIVVDYFGYRDGYHATIAHGGVLSEGTVARLTLHHGVIFRVELLVEPVE